MTPSVGRVVHYVSYGTPGGEYVSQCRAAVITEVPSFLEAEPFDGCPNGTDDRWLVGLAVLNPSGMFFSRASYDEWDGTDTVPGAEPQGGSWHWPERP
ncbi:hypothetical protein [Streptomyces sp. NPDC091259]|uniref:hypothetical protein n=1 Tax=Streptomyces sp. NPDC091259 TaxID=3365976 RepID=UPI003806C51A